MSRTVYLVALISALSSASSTVLIRQGLRNSTPFAGFWINLAVGTVGLWIVVFLTEGASRLSASGIAFFALAGIIGTTGGRLLRFVSIEQVGPSISAALINLSPLISAGLAILLLGEHVTLPILTGTVVIVAGTILLSIGGRRLGIRRRQLALPILSATCFGIVAILRKFGLGHTGAMLGSAINASTAFVAFTAFLIASRQVSLVACRGRSLGYFIAAGIAENTAVSLTVVALSFGTVSVVIPLTATAPIFVLLLSAAFLRGAERLSTRVILGTVMIVLGVYLITALARR